MVEHGYYFSGMLCSPYAMLCSPSAGETENNANPAQLVLEIRLSLAIWITPSSLDGHVTELENSSWKTLAPYYLTTLLPNSGDHFTTLVVI